MIDQEKEAVRAIMEKASGNRLDVYYTILTEYFQKSTEPESLFAAVLTAPLPSSEEDSGPSAYIEDSVKQEVEEKYSELLNETVQRQMKSNPDQHEYYKKLYNAVFRAGVFPDDVQTQTVLLYLLSEEIVCIPYYPTVNLLSMDNEEFQAIVKRLYPQFQQAIHMLNRHFKRRTEEASQLWEISRQLESEQDQIVYWAVLLSVIRRTAARSILKEPEETTEAK